MCVSIMYASNTPQVSHGEGVYLVDKQGKKYLDFNSQAFCSSLGHTVDPTIIEAVVEQMKSVAYVYPGYVIADIRSKLSKVIAFASSISLTKPAFGRYHPWRPEPLRVPVWRHGGQRNCNSHCTPDDEAYQSTDEAALIPRRHAGIALCIRRPSPSLCWLVLYQR